LGLVKNFAKALDRNGPAFSSLCEKFPSLCAEKIKVGVFIGPQMYQLFRDFSGSLKMQFLHSHLDSFPVDCGAVSDEYVERFRQDISAMENRCKGKWCAATLADYCSSVKNDAPKIQYKRQAKRRLVY
jgi:hypothetical protein